jgi:sugar phosphate isomerase/epimerase
MYFANIYNGFGKTCTNNGLVFNYHNHFREFELINGKYALEILLEKTNPKYVKVQFDVLFMHQKGVISYDFITNYKGRCPSIHVKDFKAPDFLSLPVGTGEMNLGKLVEAASQCRTEWLIVEMSKPALAENCFEKIETSIRNLEKFC